MASVGAIGIIIMDNKSTLLFTDLPGKLGLLNIDEAVK